MAPTIAMIKPALLIKQGDSNVRLRLQYRTHPAPLIVIAGKRYVR